MRAPLTDYARLGLTHNSLFPTKHNPRLHLETLPRIIDRQDIEVYFFQFSKPQGFGLAWQFDDEGAMDQAFSLRTNDALYMSAGYHPTACGPGATLYHLTFMAGPHRMSKSRVHDDFRFLLDKNSMENPYGRQFVKPPNG